MSLMTRTAEERALAACSKMMANVARRVGTRFSAVNVKRGLKFRRTSPARIHPRRLPARSAGPVHSAVGMPWGGVIWVHATPRYTGAPYTIRKP